MSLTLLVALITVMTSFGVVAAWGAVRLQSVGRRYYMVQAIAVFIVCFLVEFLCYKSLPQQAAYFLSLFATSALCFGLLRGSKFDQLSWVGYAVALIAGGLFFYHECLGFFDVEAALIAGFWSFLFDRIVGGLFAGFTLAAMLLGHYYLTQPKMPIDELRRVTLGVLILCAVRILTVSYFSGKWIWLSPEEDWLKALVGSSGGLFLMMRIGWGLILPAVLGWMVWQTVKIRSTQSATGILYVCSLAVFTGELMGVYLSLSERVPV